MYLFNFVWRIKFFENFSLAFAVQEEGNTTPDIFKTIPHYLEPLNLLRYHDWDPGNLNAGRSL
jgi:hypothetical protein